MTPVMPPGQPRHRLGGYREYAPPPHLQRFVESLWSHQAPDQLPAGPGAMHRGSIVRTVVERAWHGVRGQG
jgi:hypothetical protein